MEKTKIYIACIIALAVVAGAAFIGKGLKNFRQSESTINVTGMAEREIVSDLIVWKISLSADGATRSEAYSAFEANHKLLIDYLKAAGIKKESISEDGANLNKKTRSFYSDGHYNTIDDGFEVEQTVKVSSNDIDMVEKVYQDIANLYAKGVNFNSMAPSYYYTKLNDLKKEMLHEASKNAYERAKTIADGCDCGVGKLNYSTMGVFQIVGLNDNEDYSWGGTFNTSSKVKVASVTVKAKYQTN